MSRRFAVTFDDGLSVELTKGDGYPRALFEKWLRSLDGGEASSVSLWPFPADIPFDRIDTGSFDPPVFVQAGGRSAEMTVELSFAPPGSDRPRLFVLGRPGADYSGEMKRQVEFRDHRYSVHTGEALEWTEAVAAFLAFWEFETAPSSWHLREIVRPVAGAGADLGSDE